MKGRINKQGYLEIERSELKIQVCPFGDLDCCSDICPHFGEPKEYVKDQWFGPIPKDAKKGIQLELCHNKTLYFDELTDEREPAPLNK